MLSLSHSRNETSAKLREPGDECPQGAAEPPQGGTASLSASQLLGFLFRFGFLLVLHFVEIVLVRCRAMHIMNQSRLNLHVNTSTAR